MRKKPLSSSLLLALTSLSLAAERKGDKAGTAKCCRKFLDIWKDAELGQSEVEDAKKRQAGLS
jgi:hypothetical protein